MLTDNEIIISTDESLNDKYDEVFNKVQDKITKLHADNQKLNELKQLYLKKFFG